jgi:hypothetical protein
VKKVGLENILINFAPVMRFEKVDQGVHTYPAEKSPFLPQFMER